MVSVISESRVLSAVPVRSPVTLPVICPVTPSVPPIVVLVVTSRELVVVRPPAMMLPEVDCNSILVVLLPFCNLRVLVDPLNTILSLNNDVLSTVSVPSSC